MELLLLVIPFEDTGAMETFLLNAIANDSAYDAEIIRKGNQKEQMEEAEKYCAIEAYQPQYSMVDRKWEQLIRWACAQKMGVMTYGTLGGGILTGKYRELKEYGVDDNRNRFYPYFKEPLFSKVMLLLRTMDQISEERNVPLSQIALNWTLQRPFISSCIIGAQSRDKIEENCKVFEWKLSDDEMQLLEQALKKTII